jgi:metal-responsive CopG/Arc/MetJ family transcriptional regulator
MAKRKYTLTNDGKAKISINIPVKMLERVDSEIKDLKLTRSAWITLAILGRLSGEK